jgi:hypothetical protein
MQYRLRTLMIVLALGPPLLAWMWLYPDDVAAVFSKTPLAELLYVVLAGAFLGIVWFAWFVSVKTVHYCFSRLKGRK